jgi:hypothetical protein
MAPNAGLMPLSAPRLAFIKSLQPCPTVQQGKPSACNLLLMESTWTDILHLFTCRIAFIKSLQPCPTDPAVLQQLADHWLGCYGLLLPSCFPFLVGVAAHPEAEEAALQVR